MNTEIIAVIVEWGNIDDEPSLLTATTREEATRLLMADINAHDIALFGGLRAYDKTFNTWWRQHPAPTDTATLEDIEEWLSAYADNGNITWTWHTIDLTPYLATRESYTPPGLAMWLDANDTAMGRRMQEAGGQYPATQDVRPEPDRIYRTPGYDGVEGTEWPRPSEEARPCPEYEPGETTHRMHTDPDCRNCGQPRHEDGKLP